MIDLDFIKNPFCNLIPQDYQNSCQDYFETGLYVTVATVIGIGLKVFYTKLTAPPPKQLSKRERLIAAAKVTKKELTEKVSNFAAKGSKDERSTSKLEHKTKKRPKRPDTMRKPSVEFLKKLRTSQSS